MSQVSEFYGQSNVTIDGVVTNYNAADIFDVGIIFLGAGKSGLRRFITTFDVFGAAKTGRALLASDTILSAALVASCVAVAGPSFLVAIDRITRADYDFAVTTWTIYKAATNWTAAGGDFAAPPAEQYFTSPAALGWQTICDLTPFVTDAIANRGGKAMPILKKADESTPGSSDYFSCNANHADPAFNVYLHVIYNPAAATPADTVTSARLLTHPLAAARRGVA